MFRSFGGGLVALAAASAVASGCAPASHSAAPGDSATAQSPHDTASQHATARPIPVTLVPVTTVPAAQALRVSGRVTHDRDLKLGFKMGGLIKEILVDEGDRVAPGQVLARLDPREIDAAVAAYSAGLSKAQRDLERAKGLAQESVIPGSTRDDAQTAARVAGAQLAGARFNRETATLVATAGGVILKRLAEPGEVIGPGMPVVVIGADPDLATAAPAATPGATAGDKTTPAPAGDKTAAGILVEAAFPARDAALLAVGDPAEVTLDGAHEPRAATIRTIAPALEPGSDHVLVRLFVPATGPAAPDLLRAPRGLVATVALTPQRGGTRPAIPVTALVEGRGNSAFVYALAADGQHVTRHAITVETLRPDGVVLVRSGLESVDQVIDAGVGYLDPNATVTITKPEPKASQAAPAPKATEVAR